MVIPIWLVLIIALLSIFQGLTLKQRGGNIVVARILKGSMIDKQGKVWDRALHRRPQTCQAPAVFAWLEPELRFYFPVPAEVK